MFDGAAGVQNQGIVAVRLLGKALPFDGEQARLAVIGFEFAVSVEP